MTMIAWYGSPGVWPFSWNGAPAVGNVGSYPLSAASNLAAGFVGAAPTGSVDLVVTWEPAPGNTAPEPAVTWSFESNEIVIDLGDFYSSVPHGILTIRAAVDGLLADGLLTLATSNAGGYYVAASWGWDTADQVVSAPFWTQLVRSKQTAT